MQSCNTPGFVGALFPHTHDAVSASLGPGVTLGGMMQHNMGTHTIFASRGDGSMGPPGQSLLRETQ
jgi:hypothetical protein